MTVTPSGLEDLSFNPPSYFDQKRDVSILDRCSAFAATGPATRDGKMVIGHVTWWPLTLAEQTNVWLDIKPEKGHRMLIQGYPGAIESGTDWYQNDAGLVLTETTIRQTPFNRRARPSPSAPARPSSTPTTSTAWSRTSAAEQRPLHQRVADGRREEQRDRHVRTRHRHTKLWRSSKNEWFGGTPGFYWGNNNAKDLTVRTEYLPDPKGAPEYVPYVPAVRDLAWMDFYNRYKGQIDEQFAFTAFRTAPLVAASTMDAKVVTADMANRMMVWAAFGKPNQREWVAAAAHATTRTTGYFPPAMRSSRARRPIISPRSSRRASTRKAGRGPARAERRIPSTPPVSGRAGSCRPATPIPGSPPASASYHRTLQSDDIDKAIERDANPVSRPEVRPGNAATQVRIEEAKGVLFLDQLRRKMGDDAFLALMSDYFAANTTRTVTAQSFLDKAKVKFDFTDRPDGPAYAIADMNRRLATAIIVYGTQKEAGANRYAAEQLQAAYLNQLEHQVPIYKDFEVTDDLLASTRCGLHRPARSQPGARILSSANQTGLPGR